MRGWSILECLLVLGLTGAFALGLRSFYQELSSCRRLSPYARQVSALMAYAGTQAAFRQSRYTMELDEDASSLLVHEGEKLVRRFSLPKNLTFASSPKLLQFHESGVAQPARVTLTAESCSCTVTVSLRGRNRHACTASK